MEPMPEEELHKISILVGRDPQAALDALNNLEAKYADDPYFKANLPGFLINIGDNLKRTDLVEQGIKKLHVIISEAGDSPTVTHLYNLANGYQVLHDFTHKHGDFTYDPDSTPLVDAKRYFRLALTYKDKAEPMLRSMLRVNYGNCLSTLGRSVEAIDQYDLALMDAPEHAMAWGNLGMELGYYAGVANDTSLIYNARDALLAALEGDRIERTGGYGARTNFERSLERVKVQLETLPETPGPAHATTPENMSSYYQGYIEFCKRHHLFLNFCLRSRPCSHAAEDTLAFMLTAAMESKDSLDEFTRTYTRLSRVINEMKERFSTTRLLLYEATAPSFKTQEFDVMSHFTDNLDYAVYGVSVGKLKLAFEGAYNILDKIAFFLNDYIRLGMKEKGVYFSTVWKTPNGKAVKAEILARDNQHLFGLYDISRDLATGGYVSELGIIRNYSTHRYLVPHVEAMSWQEEADGREYHIGYRELMERAIELLQMVRSAIIYLTAFIDLEERRKRRDKNISLPLFVPQYTPYPFGQEESSQ